MAGQVELKRGQTVEGEAAINEAGAGADMVVVGENADVTAAKVDVDVVADIVVVTVVAVDVKIATVAVVGLVEIQLAVLDPCLIELKHWRVGLKF